MIPLLPYFGHIIWSYCPHRPQSSGSISGVNTMSKTVKITMEVPLDAFTVGQPLKPTGDIISGHWVNINGPVDCTIAGLPKGTDLRVGFNAFRKTMSIRHVTESKDPTPKTPKAKPDAQKLFG